MKKTIKEAVDEEVEAYRQLLMTQSKLKKAYKIKRFRRWTFAKDNDVKISLVIEPTLRQTHDGQGVR